MIIDTDLQGNKLIKVPVVIAEDEVENFRYLHGKTIKEFYKEERILELNFLEFEDSDYGALIIYKEAYKPNIIFKFSEALKERIIAEGGKKGNWFTKNLIRFRFFCWYDSKGVEHIRIVRPGDVKVISMKSIDELQKEKFLISTSSVQNMDVLD